MHKVMLDMETSSSVNQGEVQQAPRKTDSLKDSTLIEVCVPYKRLKSVVV